MRALRENNKINSYRKRARRGAPLRLTFYEGEEIVIDNEKTNHEPRTFIPTESKWNFARELWSLNSRTIEARYVVIARRKVEQQLFHERYRDNEQQSKVFGRVRAVLRLWIVTS